MAGRDKCPRPSAGAGHSLFSWKIHRGSRKRRTVLDAARPPAPLWAGGWGREGGGSDVPLFCVEFCTFSLDHSKHILCMQIKMRKNGCGKTEKEKKKAEKKGAEHSLEKKRKQRQG